MSLPRFQQPPSENLRSWQDPLFENLVGRSVPQQKGEGSHYESSFLFKVIKRAVEVSGNFIKFCYGGSCVI